MPRRTSSKKVASGKKLFNQNKTAIKNLNIDLNQRPGDLNCETYYKIAKLYEKLSC